MFRCEECNKISKPKTRQNKIVIQKREKQYFIYTFRKKRSNKKLVKQFSYKNYNIIEDMKKEEWDLIKEKESKGWETVKEKNICITCLGKNE